MADKPSGGGGRHPADSFVLGLGFVLLIVFWFINGGISTIKRPSLNTQSFTIESPLSTSSPHVWLPFLTPAQRGLPAGTAQQAGQTQGGYGQYAISINPDGARASDPSQEYITIYASSANASPIVLTGLSLRSARAGVTAPIGAGVRIATLGQTSTEGPITLAPGESAIVSTGRSPVGLSFKENKCSAYLSQFQTFVPSLAQNCPLPQNDLSARPDLAGDMSCTQAVSQISPCQTVVSAPSASPVCAQFITQRFTYNGCVQAHQSDSNFLSSQWRVYLGLSQEMWSNTGDTVLLIDTAGKVVASTTY
ncbi:MAG TPA: hypothetical protein VF803_00810 [Candidatus Paceibacterota bacterium]